MKNGSWIKMGFKVLKIMIIGALVVFLLQSNSDGRQLNRIENFNLNKTLGMTAMAKKEEEEKPKPTPVVKPVQTPNKKEEVTDLGNNKFRGDLTGYAADCPACNGTLACKPSYKVYKNGVLTYPDKTYGNVRIVASSKKLKCGSIVKFTFKSETMYAIVLDRGVLNRDLDLLVKTEKDAYKNVGRRKITYEVLRYGW